MSCAAHPVNDYRTCTSVFCSIHTKFTFRCDLHIPCIFFWRESCNREYLYILSSSTNTPMSSNVHVALFRFFFPFSHLDWLPLEKTYGSFQSLAVTWENLLKHESFPSSHPPPLSHFLPVSSLPFSFTSFHILIEPTTTTNTVLKKHQIRFLNF